jgi:hypothetical protein
MKLHTLILLSLIIVGLPAVTSGAEAQTAQQIEYPSGWQKWASIAVSHRTDNKTIRIILGNDIAVEAARAGKTNPWPDGAILGKVVWEDTQLENWPEATVPGKLVHAEFMQKDSKKFTESYGWGWGRWLGMDQQPFDKGSKPCISCHTPVKDRDWVFTDPAQFPNIK